MSFGRTGPRLILFNLFHRGNSFAQAIRDKHAFIERAPASAVASFCKPSQTASQAQAVAPQDWDCWNFWCCCAAAASLALAREPFVPPPAAEVSRTEEHEISVQ